MTTDRRDELDGERDTHPQVFYTQDGMELRSLERLTQVQIEYPKIRHQELELHTATEPPRSVWMTLFGSTDDVFKLLRVTAICVSEGLTGECHSSGEPNIGTEK